MIQVACSSCGAKLKVKDELAGRSGKCPKCGAKVQIPSPAKEPATEPEAAPAAQSNSALDLLPDLSTFASEIVDPDTTVNQDAEEELYDASSEVLHAARETPGDDNDDDNDEPIPFDCA